MPGSPEPDPPPDPRRRRMGWTFAGLGLGSFLVAVLLTGACSGPGFVCDVDASNCTGSMVCPYQAGTFGGITLGLVFLVLAMVLLWGRARDGERGSPASEGEQTSRHAPRTRS